MVGTDTAAPAGTRVERPKETGGTLQSTNRPLTRAPKKRMEMEVARENMKSSPRSTTTPTAAAPPPRKRISKRTKEIVDVTTIETTNRKAAQRVTVMPSDESLNDDEHTAPQNRRCR
ncbi:unnamed protein product [Phytophthora fragariaefolia]|uniref:Unnamed protein product n=1 Tax=Phytophthora fragariaefolia TaxID=1490495 RepID=A0A9W6X1G9_9STRA|nr:unnamed protein product [Phytophthora fragariaefolia]